MSLFYYVNIWLPLIYLTYIIIQYLLFCHSSFAFCAYYYLAPNNNPALFVCYMATVIVAPFILRFVDRKTLGRGRRAIFQWTRSFEQDIAILQGRRAWIATLISHQRLYTHVYNLDLFLTDNRNATFLHLYISCIPYWLRNVPLITAMSHC